MINFASFEYPKKLGDLPGKPLKTRLEKFKKTGDHSCSGYYQNEPAPIGRNAGRSFYLQSDFMPGLRWQWADHVENVAGIDHTGWVTDEYGDGDKIRGLVMRLNHGRGFMPGWSMGENMISSVEYDIYDDEIECAHAADRLAELAAEKAREDEAEYRRQELIDELAEEAEALICNRKPGFIYARIPNRQIWARELAEEAVDYVDQDEPWKRQAKAIEWIEAAINDAIEEDIA